MRLKTTALILFATVTAVVAETVEFDLYGRVARLKNTPENAGRSCRIKGVVSHVSAIRPGEIVLAKIEVPYRGGIPVRLPDGSPMPESGDEIWVEGTTAPIAGRMGVSATNFAIIDSRPLDFVTRLTRHQDLRNGRLTYRRVYFAGKVNSVGEQDDFTVLNVRMGDKLVHVRVPDKLEQESWKDREIELTGCVFPVEGSSGETIAYCIEVEGAQDVRIVDRQMDPKKIVTLLWIAGVLLSIAFLSALVAWLQSRRERLKLEAVEAERKRMATDLHDTIEQYLAGVKIMLSAALRSAGLPEATRETLLRANDMLSYAKGEVRMAVMNLQDGAGAESIENLLREIADGVARSGEVKTRVRIERGVPEKIEQARMQNLSMIVREAVTNAVKHGKARKIAIVGERTSEGFAVWVANDGEPFDREKALGPETGHYGLAGMESRGRQNGFKVDFGVRRKWTWVRVEVRI